MAIPRSAVADLVQEGLVLATGSGRRNDPRLYSLKGSPMSMQGVTLPGSFPRIPIMNNTLPDTGISPRNNTSTHTVFSTINSNIYIKENGCESEESEETGNPRELSGYAQSEASPKIVRGKSEVSPRSPRSPNNPRSPMEGLPACLDTLLRSSGRPIPATRLRLSDMPETHDAHKEGGQIRLGVSL